MPIAWEISYVWKETCKNTVHALLSDSIHGHSGKDRALRRSLSGPATPLVSLYELIRIFLGQESQ